MSLSENPQQAVIEASNYLKNAEMAKVMGVTERTISNYKTGKSIPGKGKILLLKQKKIKKYIPSYPH